MTHILIPQVNRREGRASELVASNECAETSTQRTSRAEQCCVNGAQTVIDLATPTLEFRAVYERWFNDVFRWIRTLGGPDADREDLVQDVFVVVYRRLPFFDGKNIAGWLFQIARNRVRDFRRLGWVRYALFSSETVDKLIEARASPAVALDTSEKRALLERMLAKLNASERSTLLLFEIEGYTGEEIADLQGVALNTVWGRIYRARKKLNAMLDRHESVERR